MRAAALALLLLSGCAGSCQAVGGGAIGGGAVGSGSVGAGAVGGPAAGGALALAAGFAARFDGSDIDADDTNNSAYTNNDPVTTWSDDGSLAQDVTQATASAKPTYKAAVLGGQDVVEFDGGDYLQRATAEAAYKFMHDGTGVTVSMVAKMTSANPGVNQIILATTRVQATTHGTFFTHSDLAPRNDQATYTVFNGSASIISGSDWDTDDTWPAQQWSTLVAFHGTAETPDFGYEVDGVSIGTGTYGGTPSTSNPTEPFTVGASGNASGNRFTGQFAEIVIYDSVLSSGQRTGNVAFFEDKYGALPQ